MKYKLTLNMLLLCLFISNKLPAAPVMTHDQLISPRNNAGELDTSFATEGFFTVDVGGDADLRAIASDSAGNIYMAGSVDAEAVVVKISRRGKIVNSFANSGIWKSDLTANEAYILDMKIDSHDRIVATGILTFEDGLSTNGNLFVIRLLTDGTVDGSFGSHGVVVYDDPDANTPYDVEIGHALAIDNLDQIWIFGNQCNTVPSDHLTCADSQTDVLIQLYNSTGVKQELPTSVSLPATASFSFAKATYSQADDDLTVVASNLVGGIFNTSSDTASSLFGGMSSGYGILPYGGYIGPYFYALYGSQLKKIFLSQGVATETDSYELGESVDYMKGFVAEDTSMVIAGTSENDDRGGNALLLYRFNTNLELDSGFGTAKTTTTQGSGKNTQASLSTLPSPMDGGELPTRVLDVRGMIKDITGNYYVGATVRLPQGSNHNFLLARFLGE